MKKPHPFVRDGVLEGLEPHGDLWASLLREITK